MPVRLVCLEFRMPAKKWQLQTAKAKLGEVIRRAAKEGPQIVTYRGEETAAVVSIEDLRLIEKRRPSLADHLLSGPKLDEEVIACINDRSLDRGRKIGL